MFWLIMNKWSKWDIIEGHNQNMSIFSYRKFLESVIMDDMYKVLELWVVVIEYVILYNLYEVSCKCSHMSEKS